MIILLHGPDTCRSRAKLREIIAVYREKHGAILGETRLAFPNIPSVQEVARSFDTPSLFTSRRLIVLERASEQKGFLPDLGERMKRMSDRSSHVVLLLWEERALTAKEADVLRGPDLREQEFPLLKGSAFRAWLARTAKELGVAFEADALEALARWREGDAWGALNDIRTLRSYCADKDIKAQDVRMFVRPPEQLRIFEMLDTLFAGSREAGMQLLHEHLRSGEETSALLGMCAWQMRALALVKEGSERSHTVASIPGLHPYVARKMISLARATSWQDIQKSFRMLHETDCAIKKGAIDGRLGAELFALHIARPYSRVSSKR